MPPIPTMNRPEFCGLGASVRQWHIGTEVFHSNYIPFLGVGICFLAIGGADLGLGPDTWVLGEPLFASQCFCFLALFPMLLTLALRQTCTQSLCSIRRVCSSAD